MRATPRSTGQRAIRRHAPLATPRYNSYPTMDRFVESFGGADHAQALRQRRLGLGVVAGPLSIYVHIPFCESLCYFCKCNKIITRQHQRAVAYLRYLGREIELLTAELGIGHPVARLCIGGGTPTFLSDRELGQLLAMLRRGFSMETCVDLSIEVDPRTVDAQRLAALFELGFNRISFGVQDFDPEVQAAVNRLQSTEQVLRLVQEARQTGFATVNLDLIYGLPRQTPDGFDRTMALAAAARPDRVALYAYDHHPERIKPQRRIAAVDLPDGQARQAMRARGVQRLLDAGYACLGTDDFALPHEAHFVARLHGRLQRDFQGYHCGPDGDLIGLGVSSAGKMGATYSQNAKALPEYCDLLDQGLLPVARGLALTRDDLVRRAVIMALMCQGEVSFELIELSYMLDFPTYFASELAALKCLGDEGLVTVSQSGIEVTAPGLLIVEVVVGVFDRYLQSDQARKQPVQLI